jgi:hypothetical protein
MDSRRRRYRSVHWLLAAPLAACGVTPEPEPIPCEVTAPTECSDPALRWAHVAPIFENRCASCHDGQPYNPWPLDSYGHVADWYDVVRDMLIDCSMPPADSVEKLPPEERDTILVWIRCGFPE